MTWTEWHAQSEKLAQEAEQAVRFGERAKAQAIYRLAAEAEARALDALDPSKTRTFGVTAVSAVALWYKGQAVSEAETLAHRCMAFAEMPPFARSQVRDILLAIWREREIAESGVHFVGDEVLFSVSGQPVLRGAAPLELVLRKVEEVKAYFFRTTEFLMKSPFRKRGFPASDVLGRCRPWLMQAPAGSYQFALRVEEDPQQPLFPEGRVRSGEIAAKFLEILRAATEDPNTVLPEVVPDPEYRTTFLKMTRNLAPTGEDFGSLEVKATNMEEAPLVILPATREALTQKIRQEKPLKKKSKKKDVRLNGRLRALHLDKDWIEITVQKGASEEHVRIYEARDNVDDVLGPMVNRQVAVDVGITRGGRYRLIDIQPVGR